MRVPARQPFSGMNREPVPYGISLIAAFISVAIVRSMVLKVSRGHTGVGDMARHPFQLMRNPPDVGRNDSYVGRNNSDIVQNLKCGNLCDDGSLIDKSVVEFENSGAEAFDLLVNLAANSVLQCSLP